MRYYIYVRSADGAGVVKLDCTAGMVTSMRQCHICTKQPTVASNKYLIHRTRLAWAHRPTTPEHQTADSAPAMQSM